MSSSSPPFPPAPANAEFVLGKVDRVQRWQVYQRLQDLGIPCNCGYNRPLRVTVATATAAIQVWSVVLQWQTGGQSTLAHLERCWAQVGV